MNSQVLLQTGRTSFPEFNPGEKMMACFKCHMQPGLNLDFECHFLAQGICTPSSPVVQKMRKNSISDPDLEYSLLC